MNIVLLIICSPSIKHKNFRIKRTLINISNANIRDFNKGAKGFCSHVVRKISENICSFAVGL